MKFHARRDYGTQELREDMLAADPFIQFEQWLQDALAQQLCEPTAMVLSTVDAHGMPDARVVLLKEIRAATATQAAGFIFFTHYHSPKGQQAEATGAVALTFHWPELNRQIRIRGQIQRLPRAESEAYFATRPRYSQLCTMASAQSQVISSRAFLEQQVQALKKEHADKPIPCPSQWGGYCVLPVVLEFFQGRESRLNDRLRYRLVDKIWYIERLAP